MNNVLRGGCQSATVVRRGWIWLYAGLMLAAPAAGADAPSPAPPPWQRDLNAARVLQTAVALVPAADPSQDADRRQRLGQLYAGLVTHYPDQAEVQKAAGEYYEQADQFDAAVACWQRAEALDPRDASLADALGSLFLKDGRVRDACGHFEHAVAVRPDVAIYHFDLANVLYLFRKQLLAPPDRPDEGAVLTEALAHFRLASKLAPADLRLAQAYAETFYLMPVPDWEQALAAWTTVLGLSGENTDFANGHLARVSLRLGRRADMDMYLDRIHNPQYDPMKVTFRRRAEALSSATP